MDQNSKTQQRVEVIEASIIASILQVEGLTVMQIAQIRQAARAAANNAVMALSCLEEAL